MFDWLVPIAMAFSMSINTPNTGNFAPDYQVQFEVEKNDTLYVGHSWERELGQKYAGREYWGAYTWLEYIYTKARYIDVPSNALHFYQGDVRLKLSIFTFGYAYKYDYMLDNIDKRRHRAVAGVNYKTKLNETIDFKFVAEATYDNQDANTVFDYFAKTHLNFKINDTVKLFIAGDIVENNKIRNWGTRAGVAVELN